MLAPARAIGKRLGNVARASVRYCSSEETVAAASAASSVLASPNFKEVKFVKEDLNAVMSELPEFNFYEMKAPEENPYKGLTMDRSILLSKPPEPKRVAPSVEFSKLENGLKIASIDKQGLTASLGLFVSAGSRYETSANFGVSHMVELMAYKSTAHLSHLRTAKTLEQLGAQHTSTCKAGREDIVYQVDVMREFVPLVVPLLVGNVLFPRLLPWEVKASVSKVKDAKAALQADPDAMINELLHKAAFCNNTLGQSPLATDRSVPYFTPETIRSYMLDHFAPERMVLVGVNVAHDELSKWAMRSFADYNAIPMKDRPDTKALYTGGDVRMDGASPYCHLAIGFESMAWGKSGLASVSLLQAILGGGSATGNSIGGGLSSRLQNEVVKESPYVESCSAFNTSYSDTGLFGVYSVVAPDKAGDVCHSVLSTLKGLSSITEDELSTAKAVLKGSLARQVDDAGSLMKDLGTQLLMSGRYGSPADFAGAIDKVSADEVTSVARQLLSSKPSVAAYGDTHTVPHYSAIEGGL
jgi:processing peptidase subunit alpha